MCAVINKNKVVAGSLILLLFSVLLAFTLLCIASGSFLSARYKVTFGKNLSFEEMEKQLTEQGISFDPYFPSNGHDYEFFIQHGIGRFFVSFSVKNEALENWLAKTNGKFVQRDLGSRVSWLSSDGTAIEIKIDPKSVLCRNDAEIWFAMDESHQVAYYWCSGQSH